jgi:CheY-like chemotaxis protein
MSKRILVVEDQPDSRQIIRDMLAPTDYEITEAENGEEALAAIAKQRPDLILMDIQLPIMDGYAATRRIKADPALRSRSRSSLSPRMRSTESRRSRRRRAVMIMCRNPTARANSWQKSVSICPRWSIFAAVHESAFGTKMG